MSTAYQMIKGKLISIIKRTSASSWKFVKNPGKDFTRKRKLSFETVLRLLVGMGGGSINAELLEHSGYALDTATSSAFIQQRDKILPFALEYILQQFIVSFPAMRRYKGYRLLAADGSAVLMPTNAKDTNNFVQNRPIEKGYNVFHLNAMYDLCNRVYSDALLQNRCDMDENAALAAMVDRSHISGDVIVIADRGYESYNNLAHIERKGWNYLIRIKDVGSSGILSGINTPQVPEFDISIQRTLTKKVKSQLEVFRFLPIRRKCDLRDLPQDKYYPMTLRIVRFKISEDTYETVVTNLDKDLFPPDELRILYNQRWGIETSFRELKYTVGLSSFHSKKMAHIIQEVFARFIMYNFSELIVSNVVIQQKNGRYTYQVNFTIAVKICRHFFRNRDALHPLDVELLIIKYILPVRPGRHFPRYVRCRQAVSFLYRLA